MHRIKDVIHSTIYNQRLIQTATCYILNYQWKDNTVHLVQMWRKSMSMIHSLQDLGSQWSMTLICMRATRPWSQGGGLYLKRDHGPVHLALFSSERATCRAKRAADQTIVWTWDVIVKQASKRRRNCTHVMLIITANLSFRTDQKSIRHSW